MRILLIEDDLKIADFIIRGLKEEFFSVDYAKDGKEGLYLAEVNNYDVIIVDWMLPFISGQDICKRLRDEKNITPVLMLTAKGDIEDRIEGLESGADDYLSKPFAFGELVARIKALHRRKNYGKENILKAADLTMNSITREVRRAGKKIELSAKEYELLEYLLRYKNRIVTITMIAENIWNMQTAINSNLVNVYIYHLRGKIDKGFDKKLLYTIRGSGYKISDD